MFQSASSLVRQRPGLSLTEVLIALFVMAIGMISLLALFPIGISNMHWAMQDSRLGLASAQAIAVAESPQYVHGGGALGRSFNLRSDPAYRSLRQVTELTSGSPVPVFWDPVASVWKFDVQRGQYPPVYVDPIGTALYQAVLLPFVGPPMPIEPFGMPVFGFSLGAGSSCTLNDVIQVFPNPINLAFLEFRAVGIPRIGVSGGVAGLESALRLCSQEDDIAFDATGQSITDKPPVGVPIVQRERRYSWAFMCRWPRAASQDVVDVSIVIYNGRNMVNRNLGSMSGAGLRTTGEIRFPTPVAAGPVNARVPGTGARFTLGSNQVFIYVGQNPTPSPWRPNDWILDSTLLIRQTAVEVTVVNSSGTPMVVPYYPPLLNQVQDVPIPTEINGMRVTGALGVPIPPPPGVPWPTIRSGIASGHFYRVIAVGDLEFDNLLNCYRQILTIDRPAKSDGFDAVYLPGVVQVIEKNLGRMPTR